MHPLVNMLPPSSNAQASSPLDWKPPRLKVLIIDEEVPFPPNAGKRIRTWNLLRRLAQNHDLTLLCYGSPEKTNLQAVQEVGIRVHLVPTSTVRNTGWMLYLRLFMNLFSRYPFSVVKHYSSAFQGALDSLLAGEDWDLVQCEWTPYMQFLKRKLPCPILVATQNVETQIWERRALHGRNILESVFFRMQARKMARFEVESLRFASAVTAVTALDSMTMSQWGVKNIAVVANGADTESFGNIREAEQDNQLVSISSLDWYPNQDALEFFVYQIFPQIRNRRPDVVFSIVGRRPPKSLQQKFADIPGVVFLGEVKDVHSSLGSATVVVVPLRIGGGSRLKILEALAAGKAVVSTSVGAEGLDLDSGKHLVVADDPREFVEKVIELLDSPDERRRLGEAGRLRVIESYDWANIAKSLEGVWLRTCSRANAGSHRPDRSQTDSAAPAGSG